MEYFCFWYSKSLTQYIVNTSEFLFNSSYRKDYPLLLLSKSNEVWALLCIIPPRLPVSIFETFENSDPFLYTVPSSNVALPFHVLGTTFSLFCEKGLPAKLVHGWKHLAS